MDYQGIPNTNFCPPGIKKLSVVLQEQPFTTDEFVYNSHGLCMSHTNFVNWQVIEQSFNEQGNIKEKKVYTFTETPQDKKPSSREKYSYEGGYLSKLQHFDYDDNLEYETHFLYEENRLKKEIYQYSNDSFETNYLYVSNQKIIQYPDEMDRDVYTFDERGFLIEMIKFREDEGKIHRYTYANNRLETFTELPWLFFGEEDDTGETWWQDNRDYVMEHLYQYIDNSSLFVQSIRKKDTLNDDLKGIKIYQYS